MLPTWARLRQDFINAAHDELIASRVGDILQ